MSEAKSSCAVCLLSLIGIGTFIGSIVLVVYSGIALNHNSRDYILDNCPNDDLWVWLIVVTILQALSLFSSIIRTSKNQEESASNTKMIIYLVLALCQQVALAVWGGPMILSECAIEKLQRTYVWYLSFIHFIIQLVVIGMIVLIAIGAVVLFLGILCNDRNESSNQNENVQSV